VRRTAPQLGRVERRDVRAEGVILALKRCPIGVDQERAEPQKHQQRAGIEHARVGNDVDRVIEGSPAAVQTERRRRIFLLSLFRLRSFTEYAAWRPIFRAADRPGAPTPRAIPSAVFSEKPNRTFRSRGRPPRRVRLLPRRYRRRVCAQAGGSPLDWTRHRAKMRPDFTSRSTHSAAPPCVGPVE